MLKSRSELAKRSRCAYTGVERLPFTQTTPEEIFRAHAPRIYSLARRMLRHDADAEDVTQDVLLQVVRKINSFRQEAVITTWLYRVTVNAALAHRRNQARRKVRQLVLPLEALPCGATKGFGISYCAAPDRQVLASEQRELIEWAIARLPEIYLDVYVLADVEGLSNADISKLLSLRVPAVKSRLHRARLMMRDALSPYLGTDGRN